MDIILRIYILELNILRMRGDGLVFFLSVLFLHIHMIHSKHWTDNTKEFFLALKHVTKIHMTDSKR